MSQLVIGIQMAASYIGIMIGAEYILEVSAFQPEKSKLLQLIISKNLLITIYNAIVFFYMKL